MSAAVLHPKYPPATLPRCYDSSHIDRVNQNQGAESLLAFLLYLAEMKLAQNQVAVANHHRRFNTYEYDPNK
jgi:hypothetical protein